MSEEKLIGERRKKGVTTVTVVVKKWKSWFHHWNRASQDWLFYVPYLLVYSVHGEDVQLDWVMARDSDHSNCRACETRSDDDNVIHTCAY